MQLASQSEGFLGDAFGRRLVDVGALRVDGGGLLVFWVEVCEVGFSGIQTLLGGGLDVEWLVETLCGRQAEKEEKLQKALCERVGKTLLARQALVGLSC